MRVIAIHKNGNVQLSNTDNQIMPEVANNENLELEIGSIVAVIVELKYESGNLLIKEITILEVLTSEDDENKPASSKHI